MKKILALLAVLLVAFMVFACGQTATTPPPAVTTTEATTTAATTTAATTTAATTTAATTTAATTTAATTTAATTTADTTAATTTAESTTAPITPGSVYVDIDFGFDADGNDAITDKKGNVTCTPVGAATISENMNVTHKGVTLQMNALTINDSSQKSWVECTFTNLADAAQLNKLIEEVKGWTVEAFYLNTGRQKDSKNITVGIVCVTEGNAGLGKQGWGLADTAGAPYFIFGDGAAWSNGSQSTVASTDNFIHVVAVYDATAGTNTLYMNGVAVKQVAATNGFKASEALGKDSTGEKVFNMGNGFFLGADPTVGNYAADYAATDLAIADVKIYAGALTADQAKVAYQNATANFVPKAEDIFFAAKDEYTLDNYIELKYTPLFQQYWHSTNGITVTKSAAAGDTGAKFWATPRFTKEDLPVGTVIVLAEGYNYRPEGWQNATDKNSGARPNGVTDQIVVIDEAWWGNYTLRAFNISTDATTKGRDVKTSDYPAFKIYVPRKAAPAGDKVVAFVPAGSTTTAINLATGAAITGFEAVDGLEIKGGTLYVAYVDGTKTIAFKAIGSPVVTRSVTGGATNMNVNGGRALSYSSYLIRAVSMKNYSMNTNLDTVAFNYALDYALGRDYATTFGKFGKITITDVQPDDITFIIDGDENNVGYASETKVNFVYFNYTGSKLAAATGTTWNPLAMNQMELIRYATDMAWGKDNGYQTTVWQEAMRTYGGLASVTTSDNTWNGTTTQNYWTAEWQAQLIPIQYASALANYNKLVTGDVTTEKIAADLAAADAALAAAQKAFDDAVDADTAVKALKDAMNTALEAYNAARQAEYEARVLMETEKAKDKTSNETIEATKAWQVVAKEIFAADKIDASKREGEGPKAKAYNDAKAAYDAAIAANATLKALNAELLTTAADDNVETKADIQKAAKSLQTTVDNYNKWAPLYETFMAKYEEAANVALWTPLTSKDDDFTDSALYNAFKDIADDNRSLPSYNYFYDAATETYTVFVTSGTQTNAFENLNTNKGNALLTGRNYLKIVVEE